MILDKALKPVGPIQIDLDGPDGNAFALMKTAQTLGRKMGHSEEKITAIRKVMMMGDYEGLLNVFEKHFGSSVILWRT